jgi:hypothetical protein
MKRKKICIILVCLLLTIQHFAARTTFQKKSETWLQSSEERPSIPGEGDGSNPTGDPKVGDTPVGDAISFAFALSLFYGIYIKGKKRKKAMLHAVWSHQF